MVLSCNQIIRVGCVFRAFADFNVVFRSLESKLETLKGEKGDDDYNVENNSSRMESPFTFLKTESASSKDTSKDGLSAGSFTREIPANWSPESRVPTMVPAEDTNDAKVDERSKSSEQDKVSSIDKLTEIFCGENARSLKRRRGKRKRREVKEGSVGESEFKSVANTNMASGCKENSIGESGQIQRSCGVKNQSGCTRKDDSIDDLMGIFESISQNGSALVFRRRLDSQVCLWLYLIFSLYISKCIKIILC